VINYIICRVLWAILVIFIAGTLVFVVMRKMPGGPFDVENIMSDKARENLVKLYGLNLSIGKQYVNFLSAAVRGDFGTSYKYRGRRVSEIIRARFPVSALLGLSAVMFTAVLGIPLGIIAALRRNTWVDYLVMFFASLGYAVPNFVTGLLLMLVFSVHVNLFPAGGWGKPANVVLPAIALGLPSVCIIARLTRSSMLDTLQEDYVKTAQAKGLSTLVVVMKHAFRNSVIPVITVLGVIGSAMIGGSIVIERVFALPGLGNFFASSIKDADYSVVMGIGLLLSAIVVLANLLVDLIYGLIDPRIVYD